MSPQSPLKLLKLLMSPEVSPFVDRRKLALSAPFIQGVTALAESFEKHGDSSMLVSLIQFFSGSKSQILLITWLCERAGCICFINNDAIKLKRDGDRQPNVDVTFGEWLAIYSKPGAMLSTECIKETKPKVKQPGKVLKYVDALDSWARLLGSHGRG